MESPKRQRPNKVQPGRGAGFSPDRHWQPAACS